jgi:hypothetical protein
MIKDERYYFHKKMLKASVGKKRDLDTIKQEAYETSITPINDSMMNHFEKRGNYTIQENVEQVNSNSSVIVSTV